MALVNTINFLPEAFRSSTNQRFLGATLDQLTTDAFNAPINGYIGRTFAPTYKVGDNYIPEGTAGRTNYQLEPSVVVRNDAGDITLASSYLDVLQSIGSNGGFTNNHERLFKSEYYTYDGRYDFDKFVNHTNYYWIPGGPDSVGITSGSTPMTADYVVSRNTSIGGYTFSGLGGHPNTILTLSRGGTYTFNIDQPGYKFWIQSEPGVSGVDANVPSISTRQVYGVTNNGTDNGTVTFNVPSTSAQDYYNTLPTIATVTAAVSFKYTDIQNQLLSSFLTKFPNGLDGVTNLQNKTFIFSQISTAIPDWTTPALPTNYSGTTFLAYTPGSVVAQDNRSSVWIVSLIPVGSDYMIQLNQSVVVAPQQKVFVASGQTYASAQFWLNANFIYGLVPSITAPADYLYYQDESNPDFTGIIKIVDNVSTPINVVSDIIGKLNYASPNGVVFTNGLKVEFDELVVPASYANNEYYVEGVGTGISLTPVSQLTVIESYASELQTTPDYITINRASADLNAWSRSNSWFHKDVLAATATYNNTSINYGPNIASRRPIVEFNANLQLFNFGSIAKNSVDVLVSVQTDAFVQIEGSLTGIITNIDNSQTTLTQGMRVIFANDVDNNVKNQIWEVNYQLINSTRYLQLIETTDDPVVAGNCVLVNTGYNGGYTWWFDGTAWHKAQAKTTLNQTPLFDIIDSNGYSFSDTTVYPGTSFAGSKLFGYNVATSGTNDTILGFPLTYQNFNNIGDIVFTNFYDTDTFTYTDNSVSTTVECNSGYIKRNSSVTDFANLTNWVTAVEDTGQYQIFTKFYEGYVINLTGTTDSVLPSNGTVSAGAYPFVQIDVLPASTQQTIPYIKVYQNNNILTLGTDYQIIAYGVYNLVVLTNSPAIGDKIDVLIFSTSTSNTGYYEVPENLDYNPLNEEFSTITLGQVRTHYNRSIENTVQNTGTAIPLRDRYLNAQGGTLVQHSSPIIYSMLFLTDPTVNFIDSINYARKEYQRFKNKFISLATSIKTLNFNDIPGSVDTILQNINAVKNISFPWYYSDMVPQGSGYSTITYTVLNARQKQYELSNIFSLDAPSNKSVLIYVNGTQLNNAGDYVFSSINPSVTLNVTLSIGDIITIREYTNTDGNYIPETPTKLGLYPDFPPEILVDYSYQTPTTVILGHDGSKTPAFGDFRDQLLLELELRIYNNLKVDYYKYNDLDMYDTIPGRWRQTDYSLAEWNQLLTQNFLQWVGSNNIDYTNNKWYDPNNSWTWNYAQSTDNVSGNYLQGSWRAIYSYWYDTYTPSQTPWEMLGFGEEPTWWATRYGPAPYTSSNLTLGEDLVNGYIWNGSDATAYYDSNFARPGLLGVIPTDNAGNIIDPMHAGMVKQLNQSSLDNNFQIGQHGPVEAAWRVSSDYPYAVQTALALSRPAEFFSTQLNTNTYMRNPVTGQFSDAYNNRITPLSIVVNGDSVTTPGTVMRSTGYLNWIADYIKSLGVDPVAKLNDYFKNLSIQLSYKVAGFTDQNLISVRAEQTSPGSSNSSIIVPDENYHVYLNKSVPIGTITYSAVIVTKVDNGYSVAGYDASTPHFTVLPSTLNNNYTTITNGSLSVNNYQQGSTTPLVVPYGTVFATYKQLADFLLSYQRALVAQGFQFTEFDSDLLVTRDWALSVNEFLFWVQQNWSSGNIIVLNPVVDTLSINTVRGVIDEITNTPNGSKLLDLNFRTIRTNSFDVLRVDSPLPNYNNTFNVSIIDGLTSLACAKLNIVQYENVLVFDNVDDFGDILYVPSQGTRQYRLKLSGSKTGLWDGALSAAGYIYSDPIINSWQPDTDYNQGDIIVFNGSYYTAPTDIVATQNFNLSNWTQISKADIQTGLLPSLGHNAQIFQNIYDVDNPPQDENYQIFSAGLLGFRERPFLSNLGISIPTQTKFYQGYIKQKGTQNAINALTSANFDNVSGTISTYEEWAFRVGTYGDLDNNNFTEIELDDSVFLTNPVAFTLTENTYSTANIIVQLDTANVYNASNLSSVSTQLYSNRTGTQYITDLPSCGYVNVADVDYQVFDISTATLPKVGVGNKIWVAKDSDDDWDVYRVTETLLTATSLTYTLDTYATLTMNNQHGMVAGNYFVLQNFNPLYDGLYEVISVANPYAVVISLVNYKALISTSSRFSGSGLVLSLESMVLDNIDELESIRPYQDWVNGDTVWINNATSNGWGVYTFNKAWSSANSSIVTASTVTANTQFGYSTAISTDEKWLYVGNPGAKSVQVFANVGYNYTANVTLSSTDSGFGSSVATQGNVVVVGAPGSANVHVYVHGGGTYTSLQTISSAFSSYNFGTSVALSNDGHWLYVGEPGHSSVYAYYATTPGSAYSLITGIAGGLTQFGATVETNSNGNLLIVGAPGATVGTYISNGNVTIMSRSGNTFTLNQTITSQHQNMNALFGSSLAIDSTGTNLLIGVPGSTESGYQNGIVERWVNNAGTYVFNSVISHPDQSVGAFGSTIALTGDDQLLAIGSKGSAAEEDTTFDKNTTVIDTSSTIFTDLVLNSGAVYLFDYLSNQSVANDYGIFSYTQNVPTEVYSGDLFGTSISATRDLLLIGAPGANSAAGKAQIYSNANEQTAWNLIRQQQPQVDITSINRTFIYNKLTNVILSALDFIDPAKGKVLNAVAQDIDFQVTSDPALYNNGTTVTSESLHWGPGQVGLIWWDLDAVRYINYEQDQLIYRMNHWGEQFPGSEILVYEWVESPVLPSQYVATVGDGEPLYADDSAYSTYGYVTQNGTVNLNYYFWVVNKTSIADSKQNSVYSIAAAIDNPQAQGVSYAMILRDDTVALNNVNSSLSGQNSILHIGSRDQNAGLIHTEYQLVQEGNSTSEIPSVIERKLIDSLAGQDAFGNTVPDPSLTPAQAYGIDIRPRQGLFTDRTLALSNYITFVNDTVINYPVVENKLMTTLNSQQAAPLSYTLSINDVSELSYIDTTTLSVGATVLVTADSTQSGKWSVYTWEGSAWSAPTVQSYKTNLYWDYADWYQTGYDYTVAPSLIVANELELGKLTLTANTYIKVLNNGNNQFAVYYINSDLSKTLVGIENGTIQLSTGTIPALEMRQIATAIQNDIFVGDLASDYNQLFFTMVKYALTEQKNIDWAFKTSFISATQYIRALSQFPSYVADNQDYYLDYINEVKPYRTVIREFKVDYEGNDQFGGDTTDFDLPPYWDNTAGYYRSPNYEQSYDANTLSTVDSVYSQWYQNFSSSIIEINVTNPGTGYIVTPQVTITGGGGSGAAAYATIDGTGAVVSITVTNVGSGYTSLPTITIHGVGTGAVAYPVMRNVFNSNTSSGYNVVRNISTTIKFDRVNYTNPNTFVFWSNISSADVGQTLTANTVIVLNEQLYLLGNNYTIDSNVDFPFANVTQISASSFNNANDRIVAFNGNINLATTQLGLEYPGVIVEGNTYVGSQYDASIQSYFGNTLGVNPSDINIDGGAYVSTYSSFGPEELVPGHTLDSLNLSVYDTTYLAFRQFADVNDNLEFYRISNSSTAYLKTDLHLTDSNVYVIDASVLPSPNPTLAIPGTVIINGEKITYYTVDYTNNVLGQIRRGVDSTYTPTVHTANYMLYLDSLLTANVGDYITQVYAGNSAVSANLVVMANVLTPSQNIPVEFVSGSLTTLSNAISINGGEITNTTTFGISGTTKVVDASLQQYVPVVGASQVSSSQLTTSQVYQTSAPSAVSYVLELTSPINANINDSLTQTSAVPAWTVNTNYGEGTYVYFSGNSYEVVGNATGPSWSSISGNVLLSFAGNIMITTMRILDNVVNSNLVPVLLAGVTPQGIPDDYGYQLDAGYFAGVAGGLTTPQIELVQLGSVPTNGGYVSSYAALPVFPASVSSVQVGNRYIISTVGSTDWTTLGLTPTAVVSGNITNGTTYTSAGNVLTANVAQFPDSGNLTVGTYITGSGIAPMTYITGVVETPNSQFWSNLSSDPYLKVYTVNTSQYVPGNVTITGQPAAGTTFMATVAGTTGNGTVTVPNGTTFVAADTNDRYVYSTLTSPVYTNLGVYQAVETFDSISSPIYINGNELPVYILNWDTIGEVDVGGDVFVPAGAIIRQSQSWYNTGTGTPATGQGLDLSSTTAVNFLKAGPGFIPAPGETP